MKRNVLTAIMLMVCLMTMTATKIDSSLMNEYRWSDVNGIEYIVVTADDVAAKKAQYAGAYVVPTSDKTKKFSGNVEIPATVSISEAKHNVVGFIQLSKYAENEDASLDITLPEGLLYIEGFPGIHKHIKNINIPTTVVYITGLNYEPDVLRIPENVHIEAVAEISATNVIFEDGLSGCPYYGIRCENESIVIPGSMSMEDCALSAMNLTYMKIAKSKDSSKAPTFSEYFCLNSYKIENIVCEYMTPPQAKANAFMLEKSNYDPKYPGDDNVDEYTPGMYDRATLYVPKAAVEAYKADAEWGRFEKILAIEDNTDIIKKLEGVDNISADAAKVVATEYYDLSGRRLEAPAERGFTITATIYSDGTRRCAKTVR